MKAAATEVSDGEVREEEGDDEGGCRDSCRSRDRGFGAPGREAVETSHSGYKVEKIHKTRPAKPAVMELSLIEEPTEVLTLTQFERDPPGASPTSHRLPC